MADIWRCRLRGTPCPAASRLAAPALPQAPPAPPRAAPPHRQPPASPRSPGASPSSSPPPAALPPPPHLRAQPPILHGPSQAAASSTSSSTPSPELRPSYGPGGAPLLLPSPYKSLPTSPSSLEARSSTSRAARCVEEAASREPLERPRRGLLNKTASRAAARPAISSATPSLLRLLLRRLRVSALLLRSSSRAHVRLRLAHQRLLRLAASAALPPRPPPWPWPPPRRCQRAASAHPAGRAPPPAAPPRTLPELLQHRIEALNAPPRAASRPARAPHLGPHCPAEQAFRPWAGDRSAVSILPSRIQRAPLTSRVRNDGSPLAAVAAAVPSLPSLAARLPSLCCCDYHAPSPLLLLGAAAAAASPPCRGRPHSCSGVGRPACPPTEGSRASARRGRRKCLRVGSRGPCGSRRRREGGRRTQSPASAPR